MHIPLHHRGPRRATRVIAAAVLAAAGAFTFGTAGSAHASDPHDSPWVCHPVEGAGELGNGWNLIDPDHASSHIDEIAYAAGNAVYGKHLRKDGRSDVYAQVADGVDPQHATAADVTCPGTILPPQEHLTVAQTITTSYNRHYDWTLGKTADKTDSWLYSPHAAGAHSDTIHWTVTATASQPIDTDFAVNGSVAVTNDGETDTSFTLSLAPAIAANIDCGQGTGAFATIAEGAEVDCTWSTTGQPAGPVTATATAELHSYASSPTAITWGAPNTVTGKTATLTDPSQGFTKVVDAANSPDVEHFSTTVNWADAPCGNSVVSNTATLTGAPNATASVTVHRQCESFAGDTAWAAAGKSGTNKYNTGKGGNWATWVPGPSGTYNLYAGQTKAAGTVTVSPTGVVTVNLTGGFQFAGGGDTLKIQGYSAPPTGNPAPGQFQYHFNCTGTTCTGTIATAKYYGIHLDVGVWVPDPNFHK